MNRLESMKKLNEFQNRSGYDYVTVSVDDMEHLLTVADATRRAGLVTAAYLEPDGAISTAGECVGEVLNCIDHVDVAEALCVLTREVQ